MQLQTKFPESKFPSEYNGVIFIHIDQHLKKLLKKYKGVPVQIKVAFTTLISSHLISSRFIGPHFVFSSV